MFADLAKSRLEASRFLGVVPVRVLSSALLCLCVRNSKVKTELRRDTAPHWERFYVPLLKNSSALSMASYSLPSEVKDDCVA